MKNNQLRRLIEIAVFAALSLIFDIFIPSLSPAVKISFKMLPIIILAAFFGVYCKSSSEKLPLSGFGRY